MFSLLSEPTRQRAAPNDRCDLCLLLAQSGKKHTSIKCEANL